MAGVSDINLQPLSALRSLAFGPVSYFLTQINASDNLVRAGAWAGLIEHNGLHARHYDRLLADCHFPMVRDRAFAFFEHIYEHEFAARAVAAAPYEMCDWQQRLMLAQIANDSVEIARSHIGLYLESGEGMHLASALWPTEQADGNQAALQLAVRSFAAQPFNPALMLAVLQRLEGTQAIELVRKLELQLAASPIHRPTSGIVTAIALNLEGNTSGVLVQLDKLDADTEMAAALAPFQGLIQQMRIAALDKAGKYRRAYEATAKLNAHLAQTEGVNPRLFYQGITDAKKIPFPALPDDQNRSVVQMTGFPRSGTTLLENALAAHPAIETFEEVPALAASREYLDRALSGGDARRGADVFVEARDAYYAELDRRRAKPGADVLIDKMPLQSANAVFMSRLFPDRRYIFSIRHPYDVVLSCFRQRFAPNAAMANFHTLADAARLYDFTMTEWFSVYTLEDANVRYVRYDRLVEEFENEMRGVLNFLGQDWSDEVLEFAEKAKARAAQTPSYQKVRMGLSLGLQSNWSKYGFAFEGDATKPLQKWVKLFGYASK